MFAFADQFAPYQRQSLQSAQAIATASFAGLEKLTRLNVQAAQASVEEGVQKQLSFLEAKDAKALSETLTENVQPLGDRFAAYAKQVYAIASETGAEIRKVVEQHLSDRNRQFAASLDAFAKNAPAGSEGALTLVKSAVSAANATWEQVSNAGQQVIEMAAADVSDESGAARTAGKRKAA